MITGVTLIYSCLGKHQNFKLINPLQIVNSILVLLSTWMLLRVFNLTHMNALYIYVYRESDT